MAMSAFEIMVLFLGGAFVLFVVVFLCWVAIGMIKEITESVRSLFRK